MSQFHWRLDTPPQTRLQALLSDGNFITGQTRPLIGPPVPPAALIGGEQINLVLYRRAVVIPVDVL